MDLCRVYTSQRMLCHLFQSQLIQSRVCCRFIQLSVANAQLGPIPTLSTTSYSLGSAFLIQWSLRHCLFVQLSSPYLYWSCRQSSIEGPMSLGKMSKVAQNWQGRWKLHKVTQSNFLQLCASFCNFVKLRIVGQHCITVRNFSTLCNFT